MSRQNFAIRCSLGCVVALLILVGPLAGAAASPEPSAPTEASTAEGGATPAVGKSRAPDDPFDRGTPRSAIRGFLEATRAGDYTRAAEFLDLRRFPADARAELGPRLADELKVVLDQTLWVEYDGISDDPEGFGDDGLAWYRDRVGTIESGSGNVELYLDRVPRGDGVRVWKISGVTLEEMPRLYAEFGPGPLRSYLPDLFFSTHMFEIQLWQWLGILVIVVLAYLLSWLVARLIVSAIRPLVGRSSTTFDDRVMDVTAPPLRLMIAIGLFAVAIAVLGLNLEASRFMNGLVRALALLSFTWLLFRLVDVLTSWMSDRLTATGQASALHLLPMGGRFAKALLGGLAALGVLQNFGINVTGLIAGLGFGGLAFALAAQKTLENLFGGMTLLADQPVRVGDFCRFGTEVGVVEDIGLRSTRIRTLDRTIITVPNAEFSTLHLENFAKRDKIKYSPTLGLRYETTPDQLRFVLVQIREMLYRHPQVDPDPARVRFLGFGACSLDIGLWSYIHATDYSRFLEIAEDLNLRIMDIVASAGTGFAFPSQTLYVGRDDGLDAERSLAAEQQVEEWRKSGDLHLPGFPQQRVDELARTLEYPAAGSSLGGAAASRSPGGDDGGD